MAAEVWCSSRVDIVQARPKTRRLEPSAASSLAHSQMMESMNNGQLTLVDMVQKGPTSNSITNHWRTFCGDKSHVALLALLTSNDSKAPVAMVWPPWPTGRCTCKRAAVDRPSMSRFTHVYQLADITVFALLITSRQFRVPLASLKLICVLHSNCPRVQHVEGNSNS